MKIYTTEEEAGLIGVFDAEGWQPSAGTQLVAVADVREELRRFAREVGWSESALLAYLDRIFPKEAA